MSNVRTIKKSICRQIIGEYDFYQTTLIKFKYCKKQPVVAMLLNGQKICKHCYLDITNSVNYEINLNNGIDLIAYHSISNKSHNPKMYKRSLFY